MARRPARRRHGAHALDRGQHIGLARTPTRSREQTLRGEVQPAPFLDLASGYIERAAAKLPKQGDRAPWKLHQNYLLDLALLRFGKIEDGYLVFSAPQAQAGASLLAP